MKQGRFPQYTTVTILVPLPSHATQYNRCSTIRIDVWAETEISTGLAEAKYWQYSATGTRSAEESPRLTCKSENSGGG